MLHVPDDALLALVPVVDREAVHVDLLPRLAPQLDRVLLRALLAKLSVGAAVIGALLAAVPDGAALDHLQKGLEDGDAGRNDDEVSFDTNCGGLLASRALGVQAMGDTYDVQYNGSHRSS